MGIKVITIRNNSVTVEPTPSLWSKFEQGTVNSE